METAPTVYFRKRRLTQYPKKGRYDVAVFDSMEDAINANSIEFDAELIEARVKVLGRVKSTNVLLDDDYERAPHVGPI